ncbi:MAG TPA: amino acid adenylation domain-containing protein [Ktedonobacteraceae bacterium]|nr:amino acid adenylation domain-containing protein [Ktedonobacteraceae bacterium]
MSNSNEIDTYLSKLSPARKALLEKWKQSSSAGSPVHTIPPRREQGPIALSFAQQRLWFLHQLEPSTPYYTAPVAVRLQGVLRIEVLERSLNEIVRRHEALRTTFPLNAEAPVQMIVPRFILSIPIIDLSSLAGSEQKSAFGELVAASHRNPFDLQSGPLLRPCLFKFGPQEYIFLLTMHHIITDGWSSGLVVRELSTLYNAFASGKLSPLKELAIQYPDYAIWQRQRLQGEVLQTQLAYWRKQLAGISPLTLPTDYPRPAVERFRGAFSLLTLPYGLTAKLQTVSQREGATLFMTLLAAFQCLLARYTSQEDIVVGTPIANRTTSETEELIGCFVNTLVLRTDLSGDPSFRDLLGRVKEMCLDAYGHQDLPFERLVEEVQPERDRSRNPLFQVMFVLQNVVSTALEIEGLAVHPVTVGSERARFDLTVSVEERPQGLKALFEYNTDLFREATIARFAGHYQALLERIADNPERRLAELSLLTERERRQIVVEWNATSAPFSEQRYFTSLVEAQVIHRPEATAVRMQGQCLSYGRLDTLANRIAHGLHLCGVGPEVLVALLCDRDVDWVVALVAIFKAGGAYLPLDPHHPAPRQRQVLAASGAKVVLTTSGLAHLVPPLLADLPPEARPGMWSLEDLLQQPVVEQTRPVSTTPIPHQLAYVLYTSGSTGLPKGAMIEQSGMLNHLQAKITALQLTSADRVAQTASQCFDISLWQLLAPLLVGGEVHIFSDAIAHDPLRLLLQVQHQRISVLEIVPSMLQAMLETLEVAEEARDLVFPALRWLILTGEALPLALCRRWFARYPHIPIMNAYGPTECSDDVTHYMMTQIPQEETAITPIGRPVVNMQLYVLDQRLEPVPIGVVGELYAGGIGVGRGYLRDSWRTAESFVPDPFSSTAGMRLYRTGDSARYRGDGVLEYLGRLDQQVKLRGHRIELGEIEAVLSQHQDVLQCVVVLRETAAGEKMLVAYVVFKEEKTLSSGKLRHFLKQRLPEALIPSVFLALTTLPLTANGKVDRQRLPAPTPDEGSTAPEMPRTMTEEIIAGIWADLLQREYVGLHANFFELGGHSLLATQVLVRMRKALEIEIPLRALFEEPTVAGFAARVEQMKWEESKSHVPEVARYPHGNELMLSFAQQGIWFLEQWEPGTSLYNMPSAMHITGQLDTQVFERSLNAIVQRHEILRSTFALREGRVTQVIHPSLAVTIPIIDLSGLSEPEREREIRQQTSAEADRPFDLEQGPLVRAELLQVGEREQVMVLNLHHLVTDGWSFTILMEELCALYEAFSQGRPSPLSEVPIQYADYVLWQREHLQGQALQSHIAYWKQHLDGLPELELPIDRPRPAVPTSRGATHTFVVHQALAEELEALSRREGATLFMLLLAVFQALLSCYSGQQDIVVGTDIANRPRAEFEKAMGLFLNMLVLRTDLAGNPTFLELLQRVRHLCLEAYAHQDLPFERLVHLLKPKREGNNAPLFQACIALQNTPRIDLMLGESILERMEIQGTQTKYDLLLVLADTQQGLKGYLGYAMDLFDHSTIVDFGACFQELLALIVACPTLSLSELKERLARFKQTKQEKQVQMIQEKARQKLRSMKHRSQDRSST